MAQILGLNIVAHAHTYSKYENHIKDQTAISRAIRVIDKVTQRGNKLLARSLFDRLNYEELGSVVLCSSLILKVGCNSWASTFE